MRPASLAVSQSLPRRILLNIIGKVNGECPDIMRLLFHRPDFFGTPFTELVQVAMRGPSPWSVAEREILATRVSMENECPFCHTSHAAIVKLADPERDAVASARGQGVDAKLGAALEFVALLARDPNAVDANEIGPLHAAGLTDEHIEDAIQVCFIFCCINRIANAFEFQVMGPKALAGSGKRLLTKGYRI